MLCPASTASAAARCSAVSARSSAPSPSPSPSEGWNSVGERPRAQPLLVELLDLRELPIRDDGARELQLPGLRRGGVEDVAAGAQQRLGRRHQRLPLRVERRVGDLREELPEVVEERLPLRRQHGQRRVVAHRADRLLGRVRHGRDQHDQLLGREAVALLAVAQGGEVGARHEFRLGQVVEAQALVGQPVAVGARRRERLLDLVVGDDAALVHVDQEDAPRLHAPALGDALGRDVEHARLRAHHDDAVLGHAVAQRPQAVAVQHDAQLLAVGGGDHRGAVPGLHQRGVEVVEVAPLLRHRLVPLEGLGDHHHQALGQRAAGVQEQLQGVVEGRGVALAGHADGEEFGQVLAERVRRHHALAGGHGVDVAAQRVDLAVVADVPVGVRQRPGPHGVGAEARMHQREAADRARVEQVGVEARELRGDQQPLVDDAVAGQRGDVELLGLLQIRRHDGVLEHPPHDVEPSLQGVAGQRRPVAIAADEEALADDRQHLPCARARWRRGRWGRRASPAARGPWPPPPRRVALRTRRVRRRPGAGRPCPRRTRPAAAARCRVPPPRGAAGRRASPSAGRRRRR